LGAVFKKTKYASWGRHLYKKQRPNRVYILSEHTLHTARKVENVSREGSVWKEIVHNMIDSKDGLTDNLYVYLTTILDTFSASIHKNPNNYLKETAC